METNAKNFKTVTLFAVLVFGVVLLCGCAQNSEKNSDAVSSQEQKVETGKIDTGLVCPAGTEKTVVGRKYVRTGVETHTLRGRSMELCCWEVGEGKTKKKIATMTSVLRSVMPGAFSGTRTEARGSSIKPWKGIRKAGNIVSRPLTQKENRSRNIARVSYNSVICSRFDKE